MTGLIDQIKQLSAAEDFFDFFQVPYDRHVVDVCRLHIMKRMGQYLAAESFEGKNDDAVFLAVREVVARAYADFARSTPAQERVFKVFRDQQVRREGAFVGLDTLAPPITKTPVATPPITPPPSQTRQTAPNPPQTPSKADGDLGQPPEMS